MSPTGKKTFNEYRLHLLLALHALFVFMLFLFLTRTLILNPAVYITASLVYLGLIVLSLLAVKKSTDTLSQKIVQLEHDNRWKGLMMDTTDEIFVVLNMYGQIVTYNSAFEKHFPDPAHELLGKPLRTVLFPDLQNDATNLNYILLEKFRSVFRGNETDFTFSTSAGSPGDIKTISFKMLPVLKDQELQNILVSGHISPDDRITNNYLVSESAYYVMDNDVGSLYQLSYRLTRNLGKWFSKNELHLIQMALHEVLINAVEHGNLEIDFTKKTSLMQSGANYWDRVIEDCNKEYLAKRKVYIYYTLDGEKVCYTVKDDGKGFDWRRYLEMEQEVITTKLDEDYHGIGLYLVKTVFSIRFEECGNEVILTKYFPGRS